MAKINLSITQKVIGTVISIMLVLGGVFVWQYDRDYSKLYSDNKLIARERFVVEMNRVYSTIKYDYQRNNCLEIGGNIKDYETSDSRCYYPQNYYLKLNRKLKNTFVDIEESEIFNIVNRNTDFYKYGTKGTVAASLVQNYYHLKDVKDVKQFPREYITTFTPEDNTKYKLIWEIDKLKEINVPNGKYSSCKYEFGKILIDLGEDCSKLDYAEIINEADMIRFYFLPKKGEQELNLKLVDPPTINITDSFPHIFINESFVMVESETGSKLNISDSSTEVGVKRLGKNKYEWYYIYTYTGPQNHPYIHMSCNSNYSYNSSNYEYVCGDITVEMGTPSLEINISEFDSTQVLMIDGQQEIIKFKDPSFNPDQNYFKYVLATGFDNFEIGDKIVLDPIITIQENDFIDNSSYINMRGEGGRFSHLSIGGNT